MTQTSPGQLTSAQQLGQAPLPNETVDLPTSDPAAVDEFTKQMGWGSHGSTNAGTAMPLQPNDPGWQIAMMMAIMKAGHTTAPANTLQAEQSGLGNKELQQGLSEDQATDTPAASAQDSTAQPNQIGLPQSGPVGDVLAAAHQYLGIPYVYGGTNPATGLDCSGFVQLAFSKVGVNLPRTTYQMVAATQAIGRQDLKPGDLIFFNGDVPRRPNGHVGIYVGGGMMIDAPHTGTVVRYDNINWGNVTAYRRA